MKSPTLFDPPPRDHTTLAVVVTVVAFLLCAAWLIASAPAQDRGPQDPVVPVVPGVPSSAARAALTHELDALDALIAERDAALSAALQHAAGLALESAQLRAANAALAAQVSDRPDRFAPWPDTAHYFGCISNIADGDALKAQPGELCLGTNLSNRKAVFSPTGQVIAIMPVYADISPLIVRYHNGREKARLGGRLRCRSGSLTTVYRAGAVPLSVPSEGEPLPLTRPTVAPYPLEPRDYVHPADFPLLVERIRRLYAGEQFVFLDNAAGHHRHGFVYTWQQSLDLVAAAAAAGRDIGARLVFNVVYQPEHPDATPAEWQQLAAAVTADHAVMFEWLPADLARIERCVRALLDAGCTVILSGEPVSGAAWIKATFPPGARLYQCRNPFNNTSAYLAHFRRN